MLVVLCIQRVCLVPKSPAKSAGGSLSGASSAAASLNSTPETKTRRRRRQVKDAANQEPVEMVRLKSADRRARQAQQSI